MVTRSCANLGPSTRENNLQKINKQFDTIIIFSYRWEFWPSDIIMNQPILVYNTIQFSLSTFIKFKKHKEMKISKITKHKYHK